MKYVGSERLDQIGERTIINEILAARYGDSNGDYFGNDCAIVSTNFSPSSLVVATTDPCPEPMASLLGFDDLFYWGWLLATINLSDIAAAGATPSGLLTSLILPNDTLVEHFLRLLEGIDECCRQSETKVVGGNIKEGPNLILSATAFGVCERELLLSRRGCKPGDLIVVIGDVGLFWAGVVAKRKEIYTGDYELRLLGNVLTPRPKVKIGQLVATRRLLSACIDNSDGLYPSLVQLAEANKLQMHLNLDGVNVPDEVNFVSDQTGIEAIRFAMGWGDWQLIGCCSPRKLSELEKAVTGCSENVTVIGEVREGSGVILNYQGKVGKMMPIDSQRFTQNSWFTTGIESYEKMLFECGFWEE
jgi:thiamine-monophosphate kinase